MKLALFVVTLAVLNGCASTNDRPAPRAIDDVYEDGYRAGGRDGIEMLREGMRVNNVRGAVDPYVPLRRPDDVLPIYVVPHVDESSEGRVRVGGRWDHEVIRWSDWDTQ